MAKYSYDHIHDRIIEEIKCLLEVAKTESERLKSINPPHPSPETEKFYMIESAICVVSEFIEEIEFLDNQEAWEAAHPDDPSIVRVYPTRPPWEHDDR